jgi:hypothetical protein
VLTLGKGTRVILAPMPPRPCIPDAARAVFVLACLSAPFHAVAQQPSDTVKIGERRATVTASSALKSTGPGAYGPAMLFDGKKETAWVEGARGDGAGEWVEVAFDDAVSLEGFLLVPGYARSADVFYKNVVPTQLELLADGKSAGEYTVSYWRDIDCKIAPGEIADNASPRMVVFPRPLTAHRFRLVVKGVERTRKTRDGDLGISEWILLVPGAGLGLPGLPLPGAQAAREALLSVAAGSSLPADRTSPRFKTSPALRTFAALTAGDKASLQKSLIERGAGEDRWTVEGFLKAARTGLLGAAVTLPYGAGGGPWTQWSGEAIGAPVFRLQGEQGDAMAWIPELSFEGSLTDLKIKSAGGILGSARCDPPDLPGLR